MTGQSIKALTFDSQESGKHLKTTLQKFLWRFMSGKVRHQLVVKQSAFSKKVNLILDGRIIFSKELVSGQQFNHSFVLEGNQLQISSNKDQYQLKLNKVKLMSLNCLDKKKDQLENGSNSFLQNYSKIDAPPLSQQSYEIQNTQKKLIIPHQLIRNASDLDTIKAILDTQIPNKTDAPTLDNVHHLCGIWRHPNGNKLYEVQQETKDSLNTIRNLFKNEIKLQIPEKIKDAKTQISDPNIFSTIQSIFSTPQLRNPATQISLIESNDIFPKFCASSTIQHFSVTNNVPTQICLDDSPSLPTTTKPLFGGKVLREVNQNKRSLVNQKGNKNGLRIDLAGCENVEVQ